MGDTVHIWDGTDIVADIDGNVSTIYLRGISLIFSETAGVRTYYHQNAHGDVVMLTDGQGNIIKTYEYDAFGVEWDAVDTDNNPFRYCGEYFDKETKTVYLRARYYDSAYGRFTQQDGWEYANYGDPLSLNLYTYCWNNPVMYVDYTGNSVASAAAKLAPTILAEMAALASLGAKALALKISAMVAAIAPYLIWILAAVVAVLVTIVIVEQVKAAEVAKEAAKAAEEAAQNADPKPDNTSDADDKAENSSRSNPDIKYPGDDPKTPPEGYEWKGPGEPGSKQGNYYNPDNKTSLSPDLDHQPPIGPHWDYSGPEGKYRIFPNGDIMPK